ncbi:MAG: hypothetical protein K2X08_02200 [Chlamydiales bacterium]|nr:hypothetical protein [Chlamydiales bacterium]
MRQRLQDEKSSLFSLQQKAFLLEQEIKKTDQDFEKEKNFIETHANLQGFFEAYRKTTYHQQKERLEEKRSLERELSKIQEKVRQMFQKSKSYEIPYENYQRQSLKQQRDSEQKILDETGLILFRRKKSKI